jgi:hypothetical protein
LEPATSNFARRALRGSHICKQHQAANQQHTAAITTRTEDRRKPDGSLTGTRRSIEGATNNKPAKLNLLQAEAKQCARLTDRDKEEHRGCNQQQTGEAEIASSGGETVRKGRCPLNPAPPAALAGALASHEQLQGMKPASRKTARRTAASNSPLTARLGIKTDFARRALRGSHCEQHQAANQQHTAPSLGRQEKTGLRSGRGESNEGATNNKQAKLNFKWR